MGADISMRAGDEVVIKYTDIDMVKQMQENHGGWTDAMEECLVRPWKFIQFSGADAVVKAPSGRPYRLNSELLMKYNKPGESMLLTSKESVLRAGLEGGNKFDEVKCLVGQRVELVQKGQDGKCIVKHQSKVYTVNENCFQRSDGTRKTPSSGIYEGARVRLTSDADLMKRLQEGHGGWSELMRLLLGKEVDIMEVFIDGDLHVSWGGTHWLIDPHCVGGDRDLTDTKREPLQKGDLVLISNDIDATKELQRCHGSSIMTRKAFAGQTGRVESVLPTGDVRVKICGMSILYNPLVLTKISGIIMIIIIISLNEHVPLAHENVHEKSYDDEKEEMRLRIQKLEDEKKCIICYDNDVNVTLGCGHRICETCAKNLYECPMCRKKIVQKIRTF